MRLTLRKRFAEAVPSGASRESGSERPIGRLALAWLRLDMDDAAEATRLIVSGHTALAETRHERVCSCRLRALRRKRRAAAQLARRSELGSVALIGLCGTPISARGLRPRVRVRIGVSGLDCSELPASAASDAWQRSTWRSCCRQTGEVASGAWHA